MANSKKFIIVDYGKFFTKNEISLNSTNIEVRLEALKAFSAVIEKNIPIVVDNCNEFYNAEAPHTELIAPQSLYNAKLIVRIENDSWRAEQLELKNNQGVTDTYYRPEIDV